jgi:hypothetical protein
MSLLTKASTVTTPTAYSEGLLHSVKPVVNLGSELVTNGSFDTDSDWSKTSAVISNGEATVTVVGGAFAKISQSTTYTSGRKYRIKGDIQGSSGSNGKQVRFMDNGSNIGGLTTTNGVVTLDETLQNIEIFWVANSNSNGVFIERNTGTGDYSFTIDNVSVKEVIGADFDFARASSATRVNEQGYIEDVPYNLVQQSNTFDTTWVKNNGTTLTGGQIGYDGSNDAWLLTKPASGFTNIAQTFSIKGNVTFSVFAKQGSLSTFNLRMINTDEDVLFDLSSGTISSSTSGVIDSNISAIPNSNGWYRCSFSADYGSGTQVAIYVGDVPDTTAGNIYIQDAQLVKGSDAKDYLETTDRQDIPRINYEGGNGHFLLEPSRTNLVTDSEYFDIYTKSNATITDNDSTSPEGVDNAASLAGNGASTSHYIYRNYGSATSGTSYTFSFFAKKGSLNYVQFVAGSGAFGVLHQNYDLENGVLGSSSGSVDSFIEDYGNGWYRVGTTITATASTTIVPFIALANSSTMSRLASFATSNDVKIYGLQIEAGYLTSYIPTYGSTVTRAAETCNNAGNSDLFNDSEGVLYAEFKNEDVADYRLISISDGTTNNRTFIGTRITTGYIYYFVLVGGATSSTYISTQLASDFNKVALKYKTNDFALWINGTEVYSDTSGATYSANTLDRLNFDNAAGAGNFVGKTKMVSTFTEALSDSELECLTSWSSFNRMATAQNYNIE